MKFIKKNMSTILLLLIFFLGLSLLLYPTISEYWNSFHQSRAISSYVESLSDIDEEEYDKLWDEAVSYNNTLLTKSNRWFLTDEEESHYNSILDVTGSGIMGYIYIPSIRVTLPIYHGTSDEILQVAVGQLPGSSFPVGGESTHCVISGHRGLPSAKLFTDIDQLTEGDIFTLNVLNQTLTYEVDQIRIVEPDDVSDLEIVEGEDYCTLVTCTPYGINTHRLLVRGKRIENLTDDRQVPFDALQMDEEIVAIFIALPILLILFIWVMVHYRKKR